MLKLHVNGSWMNFRDAMKNRDEFNAGKMSNDHGTLCGRVIDRPDYDIGQMPFIWADRFKTAMARREITYVVYSYVTPIAWFNDATDEWIVPDVRYSVTTSKHQGRIAPGCTQLNMVA